MKPGPSQTRHERIRRIIMREIACTEGVSVAYIAERLGKSPQALHQRLEEGGNRKWHLDELDILAECLPNLLRALGFERLERVAVPAKPLPEAVADVIRELSAVATAATEAQKTGQLQPSDSETIRRKIGEARRALEVLESSVAENIVPFVSRR